jgi:hypothetical protein
MLPAVSTPCLPAHPGRLLTLMLAAALAAGCAASQPATAPEPPAREFSSPEELAAYCADQPCRRNITFALQHRDGRTYEYNAAIAPPVIQDDGRVLMFPDETLLIEAAPRPGSRLALRHVDQAAEPAITLTLRLAQAVEPGGQPQMELTVTNPLSFPVRFRLRGLDADDDDFQPLRSCPVPAGQTLTQRWPLPLVQLRLSEFRLLDLPGDRLDCLSD